MREKSNKETNSASGQYSNWLTKFLSNQNTEKAISIIFPILLAVIIGFATNSSTKNEINKAIILWFVAGILLVIFIVLLCFCWHFQKTIKSDKFIKATNINKRYMNVGSFLSDYISSNIYNIKKFEITDDNGLITRNDKLWVDFKKISRFREQWNTICKDLRDLVNILKEQGDAFGVNIILMCIKDDKPGYYMPAHSYTYQASSRASIQDKFKSDEELNSVSADKQYYYKSLLDSNFDETKILSTRKEIELHFKRNRKDQNQYIALPLRYYDKTFGILQIIAYKDSLICEGHNTEEKLKDYINNYFCIYEKFAVLTFILSLI